MNNKESEAKEFVYDAMKSRIPRVYRIHKRRIEGRHVMLLPEVSNFGIITLNRTAEQILSLCSNTRTIEDIVFKMHEKHPSIPITQLRLDVLSCLRSLEMKNVLTLSRNIEHTT